MGSRRVGLLTELFFYCTIFLEYSWGKLTEVDVLIICGFAEVLCLLCVFSIEARKLKNTLLSSTNYESCWHVASASSHGFWHVIIFGPHFWHKYLLSKDQAAPDAMLRRKRMLSHSVPPFFEYTSVETAFFHIFSPPHNDCSGVWFGQFGPIVGDNRRLSPFWD